MSGEWHARVEVGIPGFDELVHGGLPRGRSTLLAGSTGTGKTVFGLQFLVSGARRGGARGDRDVRRAPRGPDRQRPELRVGSGSPRP